MNIIKFSHEYPKLWGQTSGVLLRVARRDRETGMSQKLIEYDTKYEEGKYYPLPKGLYLQLTFIGNEGIPFCTIRRFTLEKEKYYMSLIGKEFEIKRERVGEQK